MHCTVFHNHVAAFTAAVFVYLCMEGERGLDLKFLLSISCKVDLLPTNPLSFYLPRSLYCFC